MSRRQKEPLRSLTADEQEWLRRIARSAREPTNHVIRAKQLLAVAAGKSQRTPREAGGLLGWAVSKTASGG